MTDNEVPTPGEILSTETKVAELERSVLYWQSIIEDKTIIGTSKSIARARYVQLFAALNGARIQLQRLKMAAAE